MLVLCGMGYEFRDSVKEFCNYPSGTPTKRIPISRLARNALLMDFNQRGILDGGRLSWHKSGLNSKYNILFADGSVCPLDDLNGSIILKKKMEARRPA